LRPGRAGRYILPLFAKLALLILAGAALLTALACGGGGGGETSGAEETFQGDGYSFTYPGTWAEKGGERYDAYLTPADHGGGDVSLIVHRDAVGIPVTEANIDQLLRESRPAVDAYVSGGLLESGPTKVTYAGLPGLRFEASLTVAGLAARERGTWLFDGTTEYVFRCLFVPAAAEEVGQACDRILTSFQTSN